MTSSLSVLPGRRRAEHFAAALDGADTDARTSGLVEVAERLGAVQPVLPRAEYAAELRGRLMAEASAVLTPTNAALTLPARRHGARERRLAAAAAVIVVVGGGAGMAVASESALPGQALYPVKRGIEQVQEQLSVSSAGRGHALLGQADARLAEVRGLLTAGSTERAQVPATVAAFTAETRQGTRLLMTSYRDSRDPGSVVAVRRFSARALGTLISLQPRLPAAAREELGRAAETLQRVDARASRLCAGCAASLPPLQMPSTVLAAVQVDRALLRAQRERLDNTHPVVIDTSTLRRVGVSHDRRQLSASAPRDKSSWGSGSAPTASPSGAPAGSSEGSSQPDSGAPSVAPTPAGPTTGASTAANTTVKKPRTLTQTVPGTGQLGGLTQTLLPDPTTSALP